MMSEMIERVAIAIGRVWSSENKQAKPEHLAVAFALSARAAIEAMREPTRAMAALAQGGVNCSDQGKALTFWRDMIDAALKEV
jgi:hypothetical protein